MRKKHSIPAKVLVAPSVLIELNEVIPISHELATKADIAEIKADTAEIKVFMMKVGITIAGLAVLLNRFLDWLVR